MSNDVVNIPLPVEVADLVSSILVNWADHAPQAPKRQEIYLAARSISDAIAALPRPSLSDEDQALVNEVLARLLNGKDEAEEEEDAAAK